MPSPLRSLFFAFPFVLAATLISAPIPSASAYALASPAALPMPFVNADYDNRLAPIVHATRYLAKRSHHAVPTNHTKVSPVKHHANSSVDTNSLSHGHAPSAAYSAAHAYRRAQLDGLLQGLSSSHDAAMSNSQDLQDMASQSASQSNDDGAFQQNAASKFSSFQSNSQEFSGILGQLSADKGLANYDKLDQVETMLKDIVNAHKDALSAVTTMVYNIPALGPVLGPIVYEIKCIIDDMLNAIENVTDGLLNALKPDMLGLLGNANDVQCSSQFKLLGFCL